MNLSTELYPQQNARWPQAGRHILAHYDAEKIVVYQAYNPQIGRYAAEHGCFGGQFSLTRMSWIKPNFLWMMFRCGWATKENQETVLAVSLRRAAFDLLLTQAVPSSFDPAQFTTQAEWKQALAGAEVQSQWDPDHDPAGAKVERRALQLGLRGDALARYARDREWVVDIEDITAFVTDQRQYAQPGDWARLVMPQERVYPAG